MDTHESGSTVTFLSEDPEALDTISDEELTAVGARR